MKILLHGINFAPELTGIGKYTGEMAVWLAARGHDVRVVTAPPYYPDWKVAKGYSKRIWQRHNWQGVDVWRCPLWVPVQPGGLKRVLHVISFVLGSLPAMLRQIAWRPDVVWVVLPPLFCATAALVVARLSGAKALMHIQDYEVDAAFDLGLLKGAFLKRVMLGCERWLMRRFDGVSTISGRMLARAARKGVDKPRLSLFPNWVDVAAMTMTNGPGVPNVANLAGEISGNGVVSAYRAELGLPADAVVALYSGNMGAKQGLEVLAQVARLCAAAQDGHAALTLRFVFCGNGVGRDALVAQCQGLPNVQFLDLQPAERLAELLALADVHLLPQRADAADLVMPSKLTGMLASARPVVATAHKGTELADVVASCGLVVPPKDPFEMAAAIVKLAASAELRAKLGAAGRAHALKNMDREAVLLRFEAMLLAGAGGVVGNAPA